MYTLDQATRKRSLFDLLKEYRAPDTQKCIAGIDNCFWREIGRFFVNAKFTRTLCIWTINVPNENNSAIVIPTIRGECATHRNCSQLFHTCLQRKICYCKDGEFGDDN